MTEPTPNVQVIDLRTAAGGVEYTWPLTIVEKSTPPDDISTDTLVLSLGTYSAPGAWVTPSTDVPGANPSGVAAAVQNTRTVQLLVTALPTPGRNNYYLWSRVTDSPEVVPRRHQKIIILSD